MGSGQAFLQSLLARLALAALDLWQTSRRFRQWLLITAGLWLAVLLWPDPDPGSSSGQALGPPVPPLPPGVAATAETGTGQTVLPDMQRDRPVLPAPATRFDLKTERQNRRQTPPPDLPVLRQEN